MKKLASLFLILLLSLAPLNAAPLLKNKKHQKTWDATFVLYGSSVSEKVSNPLCTAFAYKKVADGYLLLTMGHCFEEEAPADAEYAVARDMAEKPELEPVEVLRKRNNEVDVALLHLKSTKNYPVLDLDPKPAQVEDKIYVVGFPEVLEKTIGLGQVSGPVITAPCAPDKEGICPGRLLVQTIAAGGASGSPIVSEKTGKVVGILEGHFYAGGTVAMPSQTILTWLANPPKS